jgi:hypothetical protein
MQGALFGGVRAASPEDVLLLAHARTEFHDLRRAGALVGCELDLVKATKDPDFEKGGVVVVKVNLAFVLEEDKVGWMLVIYAADTHFNNGALESRPFIPTYGYITTHLGFSTAGKENYSGPCPDGGLCVFYGGEPQIFAGLLFNAPWLMVAYQRLRGGLDVEITMELPQTGTPEYAQVASMHGCVETLARSHSQ